MDMELVWSGQEPVDAQVKETEKLCKEHNIDLVVKKINGKEDLKSLQLNGKIWTVLLLDGVLVDFIENCGKTVSKIIKSTSSPNKLIFMKQVDDARFNEFIELFETPYKTILNTVDEVIQQYNTRKPSESDETTFQTTNFQSVEPLSATSMIENQTISRVPRIASEPLESHYSFSSDECIAYMNGKERNGVQKSSSVQNISPGSPENELSTNKTEKEVKSLPSNIQSVATNQLYPTLQADSMRTSYVQVGMESMQPGLHRPPHMSLPSYESSGPQGLHFYSGHVYDCQCSACLSLHSASFPQLETDRLKLINAANYTQQPAPMNELNFRPEILNLNRRLAPAYNPNIQSVGSDNRGVSCGSCGQSMIPKKHHMNQLDIGPSSEIFHSAGGASGMIEKEDPINEDKLSVMDLKEDVMVMIRDSLDCADVYNWRKLADLHKWSFGRINQLEQKWKSRKIDSPFMHLIEEFQHYTLMDLKHDLEEIPRKDLLHRLEGYQRKGLLFHN